MKKHDLIYKARRSFALSALCFALCAATPLTLSADENASRKDKRGYDPLELPQDKRIVPVKQKISKTDTPLSTFIAKPSTLSTDTAVKPDVSTKGDSLKSQVFRVQLLTSELFSEARKAALVAEEIFDQPVYTDYEVPNFKVRVGNFESRAQAESYQQKAKGAGYANAWVVPVTTGVKQAARLYQDSMKLYDSLSVRDSSGTNDGR
ncbi:MAG: SPOR domain-containing protein [candidate division Zixibacteria bacterium]|nr:SPOR domain-containing protein [candidate division Zixibacteria bacterium]